MDCSFLLALPHTSEPLPLRTKNVEERRPCGRVVAPGKRYQKRTTWCNMEKSCCESDGPKTECLAVDVVCRGGCSATITSCMPQVNDIDYVLLFSPKSPQQSSCSFFVDLPYKLSVQASSTKISKSHIDGIKATLKFVYGRELP